MKTIKVVAGVVAAVLIGIFCSQQYGTWKAGQITKWKAEAKTAADTTIARALRARKLDTVYVTLRTSYRADRATALSSPTATAKDTAQFAKCDSVISACDLRHDADESEKAGFRDELVIARRKPSDGRRWSIYGEGLYGFTMSGPDSVIGMAPVFRVGSEFRVFGGMHAKVELEGSMPPAGHSRPMGRALGGFRYNF